MMLSSVFGEQRIHRSLILPGEVFSFPVLRGVKHGYALILLLKLK
jgi:hypothetical protein